MAALKFIQINIYKGKYLDKLLDFLKEQNADIISAQEVTSGRLNSCSDKSINLFEVIKQVLKMDGVFKQSVVVADFPKAIFGNAVFSKLPIVKTESVTLAQFRPVTKIEFDDPKFWPDVDRNLVASLLDFNGRKICAASWHGAWTAPPQDTPQTLAQTGKIASYLKSLTVPFILGCDVNNVPGSQVVQTINEVAVNLMAHSRVTQTTHPKIHKIAPRGFLVDYIFTSEDFRLKSLQVPEVTVSDHLPIVGELELVGG